MSEIDDIIEEIQDTARNLDLVHAQRTAADADRKMLEILLRLAWEVKQLGALVAFQPDDAPSVRIVSPEEFLAMREREARASRDKVRPGDNIYAQNQAQADAVNKFIETGE
jgi:hypothetical protein